MKKPKVTDLLLFIVGAELVGALSALLSGGNFGEYYSSLNRPPLSPPSAVFPVVWAVLYALMGTSAYLVYASPRPKRSALTLYAAQLLVNFLYSPLFFGLRSPALGKTVSLLLVLLVAAMTASFAKVRRSAALLQIPYLLWTIYAAYLSVGIFALN